ncbi:hypothetical protein EYC80_002424 [Monilinia laxa]|uniref:Uncharacterized protein n=1 Tax=Monilinia laxa TaxID=61186 RepID=A0A5N6K3U9_MONLA|nr:hypothetical protein EYC80_002424 [Monilinia laxa]
MLCAFYQCTAFSPLFPTSLPKLPPRSITTHNTSKKQGSGEYSLKISSPTSFANHTARFKELTFTHCYHTLCNPTSNSPSDFNLDIWFDQDTFANFLKSVTSSVVQPYCNHKNYENPLACHLDK